MLELFPLMVLIPVLLVSYSLLLFPSNCLKCLYHLVTHSSLLLALILPLFKGVLQGDTLAPFLCVITLDYAMRQAIGGHEEEFGFKITKKQSRRHSATILTDLSYADDIALVSQEVKQAQLMLTNIEIEVAKIGLHINAKKTEIMSFN